MHMVATLTSAVLCKGKINQLCTNKREMSDKIRTLKCNNYKPAMHQQKRNEGQDTKHWDVI